MASCHIKFTLFAHLLSFLLVVVKINASLWPTNGICGSRVRYSWDTLSVSDKKLYRDAIATAMSTGYHALFVEVHSDRDSFKEAHNTCGMMFWHRRFLLAYEEMLRSLDTRFACITIPYWDYFGDYAKFSTNLCLSFESCSTFLKDMGGSTGPFTSLLINGNVVNGNCVNGLSSPYTNFTAFCEKSDMNGSTCSGCIPRGSWSTTNYPSGFFYSSLAKYISLQFGYAWFSQNIHYGLHQSIHNAAMGALASLPTSADPIFYNHHATVDLIHQLYFDCQIGRTLTDVEKQTGEYAFQTCTQANYTGVSPVSTSTMTMYWNAVGQTRISVENHPRLGRYFAYQPKEYWRYVSASDLGSLSYSYAADDLFALLKLQGLACPKSHIRKLYELNYVDVPVSADKKSKAIGRNFNLFQDIYEAALINASTHAEAIDQSETLDCLYYDENYGVDDFKPEFRANWNLASTAHTLCSNRVREVKAGSKQVNVRRWKEKYQFHYFKMTDDQLASASEITSTDEAAIIDTSFNSSTESTPITTTSSM
ncbi:putative tyrosinase copper-binding domain-containing protein [Plasmopara halstedii]